jgi:hypothetical protein
MIDKVYEILEHMEEELDDAEEYAGKAMACAKTSHMSRKSMYITMAEDELKHFDKLAEMLKSETDMSEDLRTFVDHKHVSMLKKHSFIKSLLTKASE